MNDVMLLTTVNFRSFIMVKLTPELIEGARQYINPLKDRELDLRGYKIPMIEGLGATFDQFDTIEFSENDIRKLDGFPLLQRLKCLLLNNNRISRIADTIGANLPKLNMVVLTNNNIQELGDLDPLATIKNLEHLSLIGNPVTHKPHYRLYVIYKCPTVRVLDFKRIKLAERTASTAMFKGKKGKALQEQIVKKTKEFALGQVAEDSTGGPIGRIPAASLPTMEQIQAIKEAIGNAKSLAEVERLNQMLQAGQIPGRPGAKPGQNGNEVEVEEETNGMDTS